MYLNVFLLTANGTCPVVHTRFESFNTLGESGAEDVNNMLPVIEATSF